MDKKSPQTNREKNCIMHHSPLGIFVIITIVFFILASMLLIFASSGRPGSELSSYSEKVMTISDGWTLTDSSGVSSKIELPYTTDYGRDGLYTLSTVLTGSDELIGTPVFCFYSNYTDIEVVLDGEVVYTYPDSPAASSGATGNTYHYVRLPIDFSGKTIDINVRCQLGDKITYLFKAPLIGAKATILYSGVMESMPGILLTGCMVVLAVVLAIFYIFLKQRLKLNGATAYTSLFAIFFAVYVFCETSFAQLVSSNGYALFAATLIFLSLLPLPLVGFFAYYISERFKVIPICLMLLCSANFVGQIILNYTGVFSFRVMLPATHITIIVSITTMAACMLFSNTKEKPSVRRKLLSAVPMIIGGILDIILLSMNKPSFNNSLWFTIGVSMFIIIQFCSFTRSFFVMYRTSLEAGVLRDMAYRDLLTDAGNRNAYERKLEELSEGSVPELLCCIIVDINDMKLINDRYGHAVGDTAIVETGKILRDYLPAHASRFRTGGDEFIVFLEGYKENGIKALAHELAEAAKRRGVQYSIPLTIAVGCGCYRRGEENVFEFLHRVDADMYRKKRAIKESPSYELKH